MSLNEKKHARLSSNWHCGVVVITTAQINSRKPEFRFCTGLNAAPDVWEISKICNSEDL